MASGNKYSFWSCVTTRHCPLRSFQTTLALAMDVLPDDTNTSLTSHGSLFLISRFLLKWFCVCFISGTPVVLILMHPKLLFTNRRVLPGSTCVPLLCFDLDTLSSLDGFKICLFIFCLSEVTGVFFCLMFGVL